MVRHEWAYYYAARNVTLRSHLYRYVPTCVYERKLLFSKNKQNISIIIFFVLQRRRTLITYYLIIMLISYLRYYCSVEYND